MTSHRCREHQEHPVTPHATTFLRDDANPWAAISNAVRHFKIAVRAQWRESFPTEALKADRPIFVTSQKTLALPPGGWGTQTNAAEHLRVS
jgi:hypothetical protein